jgi:proline iminopeptidase
VLCGIAGNDADFRDGPEMAKLDFHSACKDLKMPSLIVAGRFDRGMLPRYALQFRRCAPQAQFVMFEKSGHFPFIEEPQHFTEVMTAFLQSNSTQHP